MKVENKSWEEFRSSGLLWWINRSLHLFGWAIVFEQDKGGNVRKVYPARVDCRGFDRQAEIAGFTLLTHHLAEHVGELKKEVESELQL